MIYLPKHFEEPRPEAVQEIITGYPFATLISVREGTPVISHLPFVFNPKVGKLFGHMARANPQWRSFRLDTDVTGSPKFAKVRLRACYGPATPVGEQGLA